MVQVQMQTKLLPQILVVRVKLRVVMRPVLNIQHKQLVLQAQGLQHPACSRLAQQLAMKRKVVLITGTLTQLYSDATP